MRAPNVDANRWSARAPCSASPVRRPAPPCVLAASAAPPARRPARRSPSTAGLARGRCCSAGRCAARTECAPRNVVPRRACSRVDRRRHAAAPAPAPAPGRCRSLRACAPARLRRDGTARTSAAARAPARRRRCRRPRAPRGPVAVRRTDTLPFSVNLNAFESRLRTIFSHMSRSTYTGASSGAAVARRTRVRRARSPSGTCWRDPRERGEVGRLEARPARGRLRCARNRAASSPA